MAPNARAEATTRAAAAGFDLIDVPEIANAVLLREKDDHRQGGGAYLIRLDSHSEVVVQAPHTFFEEGTPGDPLVERAAGSLVKISGQGVKRYPEDTSDLGATKNVQGAAVRASGGRFLHVEMAAQLRRDLLHDSALRARFFDAIATSVNEK